MPHYMISGAYTANGAKGLLAEGGSSRIAQATALMESLGGSVESLYFAYGSDDIIGIVEHSPPEHVKVDELAAPPHANFRRVVVVLCWAGSGCGPYCTRSGPRTESERASVL